MFTPKNSEWPEWEKQNNFRHQQHEHQHQLHDNENNDEGDDDNDDVDGDNVNDDNLLNACQPGYYLENALLPAAPTS